MEKDASSSLIPVGTKGVLKKKDLLLIREHEKRTGRKFNRAVSDNFLNSLTKKTCLPVFAAFIHNGREIRCLAMTGSGNPVIVDMPFNIYDQVALRKIA
jgi:hypothetical protein